MVLVSHKYKFIYIKNKKVAGSSVESFFGQFCLDPKKKYTFDDKVDEDSDMYGIISSRRQGGTGIKLNWRPHMNAMDIKKKLGIDKFNNYLKFCVVRNPYEKLVSAYWWKISKYAEKGIQYNPSIEDFRNKLRKGKFLGVNNLKNMHSLNGKKSVCNFFIRYENLEEDIVKLLSILNIKKYDLSKLPNHKSNPKKINVHYSKYFGEKEREIVEKEFRNELDLFDYSFFSPSKNEDNM